MHFELWFCLRIIKTVGHPESPQPIFSAHDLLKQSDMYAIFDWLRCFTERCAVQLASSCGISGLGLTLKSKNKTHKKSSQLTVGHLLISVNAVGPICLSVCLSTSPYLTHIFLEANVSHIKSDSSAGVVMRAPAVSFICFTSV